LQYVEYDKKIRTGIQSTEVIMPGKAEIRVEALKNRRALAAVERREKSSRIWENIITLSQFRTSQTIMTYLHYREEVETSGIAQEILRQGKRLLVPLCKQEETELIACEIRDLSRDVCPGLLGIPEPRPEALRPVPPQEIDLVLVPGVAFDYQGHRIGYGKGYYDRFLPKLKPDAGVIGLAFACQVVEKIEPAEHDYPVSWLVTEKGVIKCR
jgi:5-formyltetrahydrofolate cyclo-ligase